MTNKEEKENLLFLKKNCTDEIFDIAMKKVVNREVRIVLHEIRGEIECVRTKEVSTIANTPIVCDRIGFDVLRDVFRIIDRHIEVVTDNEDCCEMKGENNGCR